MFMNNNYLYHHGILGQKWGVKNGPPYPLGVGDHNTREKKAGWRQSIQNKVDEKTQTRDREKKKKIVENLNVKYGNSGWAKTKLTKKQINELADKRLKYAKRVALAVGITAGAVVAYKGYRYIATHHIDYTIPVGKMFQTLSGDPSRVDAKEYFYTAFKELDKTKYVSFFSKDIDRWSGVNKGFKYKIGMTALKDMKIASRKSAVKEFNKLTASNKEFSDAVKLLDAHFPAIINPKTWHTYSPYDKFNVCIALDSAGYKNILGLYKTSDARRINEAKDVFFDAMRKAGYSGVVDMNDTRFNTLSTAPAIIFDKPAFTTSFVNKISSEEYTAAVMEASIAYGLEGIADSVYTIPMVAVAGTGIADAMIDEEAEQMGRTRHI